MRISWLMSAYEKNQLFWFVMRCGAGFILMLLAAYLILFLLTGCASAPKERATINLYLPKVKYAE